MFLPCAKTLAYRDLISLHLCERRHYRVTLSTAFYDSCRRTIYSSAVTYRYKHTRTFRKPLLKSGVGPASGKRVWRRVPPQRASRRHLLSRRQQRRSARQAGAGAASTQGAGGRLRARDKVAVRQTTRRQNFFGTETRAYQSGSGTRSQ